MESRFAAPGTDRQISLTSSGIREGANPDGNSDAFGERPLTFANAETKAYRAKYTAMWPRVSWLRSVVDPIANRPIRRWEVAQPDRFHVAALCSFCGGMPQQ